MLHVTFDPVDADGGGFPLAPQMGATLVPPLHPSSADGYGFPLAPSLYNDGPGMLGQSPGPYGATGRRYFALGQSPGPYGADARRYYGLGQEPAPETPPAAPAPEEENAFMVWLKKPLVAGGVGLVVGAGLGYWAAKRW